MARTLQPQWRLERRQRMLAAAGVLFARAGYAAVQMDEVARVAGVGKPTLYRYFGSKDELFLEVFDEALQELQQRIEAEGTPELAPPESLARMIRSLVDFLAQQTETLRLLSGDHPQLALSWRTVFRSRRRPILDALRRILERGVASGDFRPLDLEVTPGLILGMIRGGLLAAPEISQTRLANAAIELVLHGGLTSSERQPNEPDLAESATSGQR
jgi:AcrR family transcriptional regulator